MLSFGAALSAGQVDPPANDYLLHGMIIERASTALAEEGWVAFADPWFPELNGGAALFRQYPHLPHQAVAVVTGTLGLDPWSTFSASVFLGVFLLPLAFFLGGRMLGLSPAASATAAFVAACLRCIDPFGHHLLSYGLAGKGLYAQLWGMNLAVLALPAWIAAARGRSGGLAGWAPWARTACAALLISATLRSSLPAAWLLCLCSLATVLFAGPRSGLTRRLLRFAGVGLGAGVLSLGFLLPFFADLPTAARSALEMQPALSDSVGAAAVLKALGSGDYFDGGTLGPWTLLLIFALLTPLLGRRRLPEGSPPLSGLSAAGLLSILLLFGRATWGDWVDTIPLVGRFHDHRYLLGLQLVAPWLISGTLVALAQLLRARVRPRFLWVLGGLAVVGVTTPVVTDLRNEQSLALSIHVEFGANRGLLDALVAETEQDLPHRVALARPDAMIGGTSWLSWLRREGALTLGRPLHHYHHVHDFALWWSRWVSAEGGDRGRPVHPEDLAAAGVQRLLDPRLGSGTVEGPGPILVRSDLLVEAATPRLDGLGIRWFREGLHLGRQYPTVAFPGNSAPPGIEYLRTTRLEDHDLDSLQGLPQVSAALGQVLGVREPRPGRIEVDVDVTSEDAWLLLPQAWHRRWRVEVDGSLRASAMLLPGWMGVPLAKTDSSVTLTWPTSPLRATAAAANVILHGLLLWLLVTRRRVKLRCRPPPTQESPCAD
jgi:hypothetical protein